MNKKLFKIIAAPEQDPASLFTYIHNTKNIRIDENEPEVRDFKKYGAVLYNNTLYTLNPDQTISKTTVNVRNAPDYPQGTIEFQYYPNKEDETIHFCQYYNTKTQNKITPTFKVKKDAGKTDYDIVAMAELGGDLFSAIFMAGATSTKKSGVRQAMLDRSNLCFGKLVTIQIPTQYLTQLNGKGITLETEKVGSKVGGKHTNSINCKISVENLTKKGKFVSALTLSKVRSIHPDQLLKPEDGTLYFIALGLAGAFKQNQKIFSQGTQTPIHVRNSINRFGNHVPGQFEHACTSVPKALGFLVPGPTLFLPGDHTHKGMATSHQSTQWAETPFVNEKFSKYNTIVGGEINMVSLLNGIPQPAIFDSYTVKNFLESNPTDGLLEVASSKGSQYEGFDPPKRVGENSPLRANFFNASQHAQTFVSQTPLTITKRGDNLYELKADIGNFAVDSTTVDGVTFPALPHETDLDFQEDLALLAKVLQPKGIEVEEASPVNSPVNSPFKLNVKSPPRMTGQQVNDIVTQSIHEVQTMRKKKAETANGSIVSTPAHNQGIGSRFKALQERSHRGSSPVPMPSLNQLSPGKKKAVLNSPDGLRPAVRSVATKYKTFNVTLKPGKFNIVVIPNAIDDGACHYYKVTGQGAGQGLKKEKIDPMDPVYQGEPVYYLPATTTLDAIDEAPVPELTTETVFNKVFNTLSNGQSLYAIVNNGVTDSLPNAPEKKKFKITKSYPAFIPTEVVDIESPTVLMFNDANCKGGFGPLYHPDMKVLRTSQLGVNPDYIKSFKGKIFEHGAQFYQGTLSGPGEKSFSLNKIAERQITEQSGVIYQADAGNIVKDPRNIKKTSKVLVDGNVFDLSSDTPPLFYISEDEGYGFAASGHDAAFYKYDVATNKFKKVSDLAQKKASVTSQNLIVVNNIKSLEGSLKSASIIVETSPASLLHHKSLANVRNQHKVTGHNAVHKHTCNLSNGESITISFN